MVIFLTVITLMLLPIGGIYFLYVAYRIWFKSDYSYIKDYSGYVPDNPDIYAPSIAKAHLIGGALVLASMTQLGKFPILDIAQFSALVGTLVKLHTHTMAKRA